MIAGDVAFLRETMSEEGIEFDSLTDDDIQFLKDTFRTIDEVIKGFFDKINVVKTTINVDGDEIDVMIVEI